MYKNKQYFFIIETIQNPSLDYFKVRVGWLLSCYKSVLFAIPFDDNDFYNVTYN